MPSERVKRILSAIETDKIYREYLEKELKDAREEEERMNPKRARRVTSGDWRWEAEKPAGFGCGDPSEPHISAAVIAQIGGEECIIAEVGSAVYFAEFPGTEYDSEIDDGDATANAILMSYSKRLYAALGKLFKEICGSSSSDLHNVRLSAEALLLEIEKLIGPPGQ